MKLKTTLLALTLLTLNTIAQQVTPTITNNKCSHAKFRKNTGVQYAQSNLLNNYDIKHVKLDIAMERTTINVAGNATLLVQAKVAVLDTIALELLQAIVVDSVKVNNQLVTTYTHTNNHLYTPCTPTANGSLVSIQVFYHGAAPYHGFFSGVTNSQFPEVTWTLSESYQGRDWWPCKQILSDKIDSVDVWITTDSSNKAGSNGLLKNITILGNKKRYEWHSNYMINYYLISAAVAKYIEYTTYAHPTQLAGDSILIQNYLYNQNTLTNYKTEIDKTGKYIEVFSDAFGLYPFWKEKYGHCESELGGGEEHQTMTTIGGGFSDDLVDHELAHQWWGDNVTCASYRDIFINEGFASYCEYVGIERTGTAAQALVKIKSVQNSVLSQTNGSVYVPLADLYNEFRIFDNVLSYDKGSAIIHMMRFEAQNDSLFFKALQNFQSQFKDSVATGEDLKTVLQNTIGVSYANFFNQWYYGEGYPKYSLVWAQANDTLTLNVNQASSAPLVTPLFKMLMEYKLKSAQGDTVVKGYQTANSNEFKFKLNGKTISQLVVDPNFKVVKKVLSNLNTTQLSTINNSLTAELYPNPTTDKLYITLEGNLMGLIHVQITDVSGRIVQQCINANIADAVAVHNLLAGTYFVKITSGTTTVVKVFVKN